MSPNRDTNPDSPRAIKAVPPPCPICSGFANDDPGGSVHAQRDAMAMGFGLAIANEASGTTEAFLAMLCDRHSEIVARILGTVQTTESMMRDD